jgi:hypothetical protein
MCRNVLSIGRTPSSDDAVLLRRASLVTTAITFLKVIPMPWPYTDNTRKHEIIHTEDAGYAPRCTPVGRGCKVDDKRDWCVETSERPEKAIEVNGALRAASTD